VWGEWGREREGRTPGGQDASVAVSTGGLMEASVSEQMRSGGAAAQADRIAEYSCPQ
jgi:hypothetical protein